MSKIIRANTNVPIPGLVVISGGNSKFGKLVQVGTKSKYDHVSILLGKVAGNVILKFESQWRSINPYVFTVSKDEYMEIWQLLAPMDRIEEKLEWLLMNLSNKPYPFESLIGHGIMAGAEWLGIETKSPFSGGWVCSRVGQHFVNEVLGREFYNAATVRPDHVAKIFRENTNYLKWVGVSDKGQDFVKWF